MEDHRAFHIKEVFSDCILVVASIMQVRRVVTGNAQGEKVDSMDLSLLSRRDQADLFMQETR
jgi:hypothetical protein